MSVLKLIGVLLDYPQDELWQHGEELLLAVDDAGLPAARQQALTQFVRDMLAQDALDAQDNWLSLFDRGRAMSLLLFEHIHGESRDRGQAMVNLMEAYRKNGFELSSRELPDYLPLVLEYLSYRPAEEVKDWLQNLQHIIALLAARAAERASPYALLLTLLVEMADGRVNLAALRQQVQQEVRDDTPEVMGRLWEEEVVRFGIDTPACDSSTQTHRAEEIKPLRFTNAQQVQP